MATKFDKLTGIPYNLSRSYSALGADIATAAARKNAKMVQLTNSDSTYEQLENEMSFSCGTAAGNIEIDLRSATDPDMIGWPITIFKADGSSNHVVLNPKSGSGQTINGLDPYFISGQYSSVILKSNGSNFQVEAASQPQIIWKAFHASTHAMGQLQFMTYGSQATGTLKNPWVPRSAWVTGLSIAANCTVLNVAGSLIVNAQINNSTIFTLTTDSISGAGFVQKNADQAAGLDLLDSTSGTLGRFGVTLTDDGTFDGTVTDIFVELELMILPSAISTI